MKPWLIELLACPGCGGELSLCGEPEAGEEVVSGVVRCLACPSDYPILRGIPRLGGLGAQPEETARTVARFGWQWKEFREHLPEYRESFLDWMKPLGESDFQGAIVLDAGCGMGRFASVAASLNARGVVALDLSESVEVAQEVARARDNLHVVQADLLRLPVRRVFDLVYTLGVLHHLPDGEDGFASLLRCVRPGGRIHVWVYGREGNEWLLRWVDPVRRRVTSRIPPPLLRILAWLVAAPLHLVLLALYRNASRRSLRLPYARYLTWLSRFPFRHTHQVVFDHLGAPIAHYYRREELAAWFERAGLDDVQITSRNGNSWRATARVRT